MFIDISKFTQEELKEIFPYLNSKKTEKTKNEEHIYKKGFAASLEKLSQLSDLNKTLQDELNFKESAIKLLEAKFNKLLEENLKLKREKETIFKLRHIGEGVVKFL
jgi:hypothetical protein